MFKQARISSALWCVPSPTCECIPMMGGHVRADWWSMRSNSQRYCDVAITVKFYSNCDVAKSLRIGPINSNLGEEGCLKLEPPRDIILLGSSALPAQVCPSLLLKPRKNNGKWGNGEYRVQGLIAYMVNFFWSHLIADIHCT